GDLNGMLDFDPEITDAVQTRASRVPCVTAVVFAAGLDAQKRSPTAIRGEAAEPQRFDVVVPDIPRFTRAVFSGGALTVRGAPRQCPPTRPRPNVRNIRLIGST